MQTLKSVLGPRVRPDQAERAASESRHLGNSAFCPAGGEKLSHDEFGRPANRNTLPILDPSCSVHSEFTAARIIAIENSHRPYMPICASGARGGDSMGVARHMSPQNIYGEGARGSWARTYSTPNDAPPHQAQGSVQYLVNIPRQPSHNVTGVAYRG